MLRCFCVLVVMSCGGGPRPQTQVPDEAEQEVGIGIEPKVASQRWYRTSSICGQGPYEIELPLTGVKWGEEMSFTVAAPRRIAFTAIVLGDDEELAKATYGERPENARCVADAKERLAAVRGTGGGGTVTLGVPVGTTIITPPPATPVALVIDDDPPLGSNEVIRYRVREGHRYTRLRIRLWSITPNDLDRVHFGITHIEWRPNVSEAEYAAYLVRVAEREAARERRRAARAAELERELEETRNRPRDLAAEAREEARRRAEEARRRAEDARRAAEDERRRLEALEEQREAARKRAVDAALALERQRRREAYCASHPESRDCWGAGGKHRRDQLEALARGRDRYCAATTEDVRCWSPEERQRRARAWDLRFSEARIVKTPDEPPPSPRDETPPPKLSENAEWRPGYWQWTGKSWFWLGGAWRVPDEDIVAEKTTTAPIAPPPPRTEEIPPPPPAPTIVWVTGFWQWNGTMYIWVPGSYQPRPAGARWRPTEWRARGSVHILVPGGWIR